jgi:3-isopropylmalate/(R)-2-methylmalate dehydratase small subunit
LKIDTDQIIPARFLKQQSVLVLVTTFRDWRYNNDDFPSQISVLNNATYGGKILVGGRNFGLALQRTCSLGCL